MGGQTDVQEKLFGNQWSCGQEKESKVMVLFLVFSIISLLDLFFEIRADPDHVACWLTAIIETLSRCIHRTFQAQSGCFLV